MRKVFTEQIISENQERTYINPEDFKNQSKIINPFQRPALDIKVEQGV